MRVELKSVGKCFGRTHALRDIDLVLGSGSRTALVGPNGSGKSTLTRVVMGMLSCDGEVRLDGLCRSVDHDLLARRIAYVPQVAPRLAALVRELVDAVVRLRELDREHVVRIAADLRLDLEALATRPFRALSGGMRQKLLAAFALGSGADLMLLDEPTASMDADSRSTFFRLLDEQPRSTTIVLSSHRLDEIRRVVDDVVVLEEGRVAYSGRAGDYLAIHAEAVVEVAASGALATQFLSDRGFAAGAGDWWSCSVPSGQRMTLLREVVHGLDGTVRDIVARDSERLDPARKEEQR